MKTSLVGISPRHGNVGLIEADTADGASLSALCAQTRIVATTVGPYTTHGMGVVEAAVDRGTHYLDITGEPAFVAASTARWHDAARDRRIRIVHCCGFDSIPADLGALFTVARLPPGRSKRLRAYVKTRGSVSGGTWASLLASLGGQRPAATAAASSGAVGSGAPTPDASRRNPRSHRGPILHRPPPGVRGVAIPMPVVDPVLVGRSAAALPERYGADFRYEQFLVVRTARRAARLAAGVGAVWALAQLGPARRALQRWRRPGEGPSALERSRSFFEVTFEGRAGDARVLTRVSGGDPGYTETSRMLARAALLLATEEDALPEASGVLTPAVAFGDPGIAAMQRAGIAFETLSPARADRDG